MTAVGGRADGWFMKRLAIVAAVPLLLLAAVDFVFSVCQIPDSYAAKRPSHTIADSKARGAYMETVSITPSTIDWNGKRIRITEAWLEHRSELVRVYVLAPFVWERRVYRSRDGYNLCINLDAESWDVLWSATAPMFLIKGKGNGFGVRGRVVLWEVLDDLTQFPTSILVTDVWRLENSKALTVNRAPD